MNNWKTTLGGILAAVGFGAAQVTSVPDQYKWIFAVLGAAGMALLGVTAKDFNTHSTINEVEKSTEEKEEEKK